MYKTIEKLKDRPEHHRKRIAMSAAFFISAMIFTVWATVLFPQGQSRLATREEEKKPGESPIAAMRASAANAWGALKNIVSEKDAIDLQAEYERLRTQVENGELELVPESVER